jgi:hypothetical protein
MCCVRAGFEANYFLAKAIISSFGSFSIELLEIASKASPTKHKKISVFRESHTDRVV